MRPIFMPVDLTLEVAWSFLGRPYVWGGDDPSEGFDCSGFVIECLKAGGAVPRGGDWTADGLMRGMRWPESEPIAGACIFWGSEQRASHVELVMGKLDGRIFTIGASGGGSQTKTIQDAIRQNAYVKIREARPGHLAILDPFRR